MTGTDTASCVAAYTDLAVHGVVASPLPGPSGNVEYFLWLRPAGDDPGAGPDPGTVSELVATAVAQGPTGAQP